MFHEDTILKQDNEYLIKMEDPEDCLIVTDKDGIYYRLFNRPVTGHQKNELDCMQFHEPVLKIVDYHEHTKGTETFIVSQGKFLCNCMGRGFTMEAGDLLHIQPWMGHSFTPIEPESRLNILFMDIDMRHSLTDPRLRMLEKFPGVFDDLEFQDMFRKAGGGVGKRTIPVQDDFPKDQVQQLRPADYGIREHEFKGIEMRLKVAKYETEGVKEIWDLFMEAGFYCEWDCFVPEYRMFYVTRGVMRCWVRTSATETIEFYPNSENLIIIPPYTPFGFEVLERVRMYDLDCSARLQDLCEELGSHKLNNEGKMPSKEDLLKMAKEYGLNITNVGCRFIL